MTVLVLVLVALIFGVALLVVFCDPFLHDEYHAAWQQLQDDLRRGIDSFYTERDQ